MQPGKRAPYFGISVAAIIVIFGGAPVIGTKVFPPYAQAATTAVAISYAPAFSVSALAAPPTNDWITNGGSLANERFSPLTEINTSNVASLKGIWRIRLRGSATTAKYSAESQPLEFRGVIYVSTGADDVFAISADTGKILWEYQAHLDQQISTVCCGWLNRGVALGAGKVYFGQLDGKLVALAQKSGGVVWSTLVEPWQNGYTMTASPLYVDGMVIEGVAGGEYGVRGRLTAFDAATGKELWRFYTIPGPGQTGHSPWPRTGNAWQRGGAPIWHTPSVDPKLGLLYFSTGNASPDNNGSMRAGKNLFAVSMVALDVKTGKLRSQVTTLA
jgi:PQQ-dependent dehydrogenase (methanol/ethanol family)